MRARGLAVALLAALLASASLARAVYPDRPVKIIVPFPAGGTADVLTRLVAEKLSLRLTQQFIVENRPGAGGNIGAAVAAKSPADGYTLFIGTVSTHAINPSLYGNNLGFDPLRDFAPISRVATMPNVLVVNPTVPAKSVKELVALAKTKPGALAYASAGNGTSQHLSGALFCQMAGVEMIHVPYKGNAPAVTDLIGGQVQLMFDNSAVSLPRVHAGQLRALAVTSAKRSTAVPELPTIAESGYPGYDISSWFALFAPARTPGPIIARLNAEVVSILQEQDLRERLARDGIEAAGTLPETLRDFILSERTRWARIVKESGARVD